MRNSGNRRSVTALAMAAAVVSVAVAGCGPNKAEYTVEPTLERTERVVFLDTRLTTTLRVDDVAATRTDAGRLVVKADVFNNQDHPIECRAKFKFKGEDGFLVDETNWMPVVFDRRQVTHLEQKSLSEKAADFVLLLKFEKGK